MTGESKIEHGKEYDKEVSKTDTLTKHLKPFRTDLPTIGLLIYDGVLTTEVTATSDVFSKPTKEGEQLFNVITIAVAITIFVSLATHEKLDSRVEAVIDL